MRTVPVHRAALAVAVLAFASTAAVAETIDERHATLGWQAENAPLVARVQHVADAPGDDTLSLARFEVLETLRGDVAAGSEIVVAHPASGDGRAVPWVDGAEHLVFLRSFDEHRYVSIAGALAIRPISVDGPETRFAGIVAEHLSTLDESGAVRDPDRLRELLVAWLGDDDPGVVWSAATDLIRHTELHAGLTPRQRAFVLATYRAHPVGKMSKRALAHALAVARPDGAVDALLDTLEQPGAKRLRGDIADALVEVRADDAVERIVPRLDGADASLRAHLLLALGAIGDGAAVAPVRARLVDDDAGVRVQAAHALGRIARAVRAADPDARIEARVELVALVTRARTANEQKAGAWALAQLDQPEAYAQLRRIAESDPRENVRRYAARYLAKPRVSLILR